MEKNNNRSLYLSVIIEALGIKRSVFSIADSLRFIMTAVVNLFFDSLIAKFGSKNDEHRNVLLSAFYAYPCLCNQRFRNLHRWHYAWSRAFLDLYNYGWLCCE